MIATAEQVSDFAKTFVGVQFLHLGRDPQQGLDCGGLLAMIFDEFGIPYVDKLDYPLRPNQLDPHLIPKLEQTNALVRQETNELEVGSVVALGFSTVRVPQHCGVITSTPGQGKGSSNMDDISLVHSNLAAGFCQESSIGYFWRRRVAAVFRIKGVTY